MSSLSFCGRIGDNRLAKPCFVWARIRMTAIGHVSRNKNEFPLKPEGRSLESRFLCEWKVDGAWAGLGTATWAEQSSASFAPPEHISPSVALCARPRFQRSTSPPRDDVDLNIFPVVLLNTPTCKGISWTRRGSGCKAHRIMPKLARQKSIP